ncbi:MAG: hypothetical protein LBC99_04765 [Spirochaetota bacterium]|nr:hypothetical protein [Spirochaetota bacterium]
MKHVRRIGLCIMLLVICFGCSDLLSLFEGGDPGSEIKPATTSALLLYNISGSTNDTAGQAIGNIPAINIPEPDRSMRSAMENAPSLLKDLPGRMGGGGGNVCPRVVRRSAAARPACNELSL